MMISTFFQLLSKSSIKYCAMVNPKISLGPTVAILGMRPLKNPPAPSSRIRSFRISSPPFGLSNGRFWIRVLITSKGEATTIDATALQDKKHGPRRSNILGRCWCERAAHEMGMCMCAFVHGRLTGAADGRTEHVVKLSVPIAIKPEDRSLDERRAREQSERARNVPCKRPLPPCV